MKLTLASIAILAFAAASVPSFAQSSGATSAACAPNGNTNSAGIVGKGNQVGAGSGTAQAGTATSATGCPIGSGTTANAATGATVRSGGSIAVDPSTANSSNGGASNK